MSQLRNHKANHRHIDEGFTRLGQSLKVFGETTTAVQPREGTLHHPPTGQQHEALLTFGFLHYRQFPAQLASYPLYQLPSIPTVSPDQHQPTITPPMCIPSFLDALKQSFEHHFASISVLYRGRSHHNQHHQTKRVHYQVPLASPYILVFIIASLLSTFYRFDALAVRVPSG